MLDCTITGVAQELDFESNATLTYLVLRLPNGTVIRTSVDEAAAAVIIELQVEQKGAPTSRAQPGSVQAPATVRRPPAAAAAPPAPVEDDLPDEPDQGPGGELIPGDGENVFVFGGQDSPPEDAELAAAEREEADNSSPTVIVTEPPPVAEKPARLAPPKQQVRKRGRLQQAVDGPADGKPSRMQHLPNGKVIVPSRTVPALDRGYPSTPGGVDTGDFTGSHNRDDDGVGSV